MKIAHILYSFGLGGIETFLTNIANEQIRLGHEVHIYVINDIIAPSLVGRLDTAVKFHPLKRRPKSRNPWPLIRLNAMLIGLNPDVIHLHYASISNYLLRPLFRKRLCVTLHAMCSKANSTDLHKCGPIYAISGMVKDDIMKRYGLASTVVYNAVKFDDIAIRRADEPPHRPLRIVQVSRLMIETKGQDILIEAAAALLKEGIDDFRVTFIGDGDDRAMLENMTRELGLQNHIEFLGSRSQAYIFEHLKDYDLFVQPSRLDGFAITVAEAMAAQVPVLVCDNMAPIEVIDYGKYGRSFRGGDPLSLADGIKATLADYPSAENIRSAREYALKNFSIEHTVQKYIDNYPK